MYDTILLATDGSDQTERVARYVATLAERVGADVHVLAAADVSNVAGAFDAGGVDDRFVEQLREQCQTWVDGTTAFVDATETAVVNDRPRHAILDYAEENGVDLVAMGTHGRTGIRRYVIGSVTEHVLRRSDVPVLTARATENGEVDEDGIDRVLVPTDGSDAATAAIDHAVAVADACDADVRALSVVDVRALAAQSELLASDALIESLTERSEEAVREVAERCAEAGIEGETVVARGSPAEAICDDAAESGTDLIVMGTRGRSGLDRVLLGSVAERTVRHAPVPVMTVRDPRE